MKFISLFAGIGGFDLGLERAGMECVAQVEIDPFCQKVLAKHWPNVMRLSDVRECGKHNLPAADLICGGFPCQPHSVAGKRRGAQDDRDLWSEYRRIVAECRPRWVIGENVPGIRTTILDQVLSDLEGLDYATRTLVVPACAFNAPHKRDRIFVIANTQSGTRRLSEQSREEGLYACWDGDARNVTNTDGRRCEQFNQEKWSISEPYAGSNATNSEQHGIYRDKQHDFTLSNTIGNLWETIEPTICGGNNGFSTRMDRLRALGNAVVPQAVEWIGRNIMEVEAAMLAGVMR